MMKPMPRVTMNEGMPAPMVMAALPHQHREGEVQPRLHGEEDQKRRHEIDVSHGEVDLATDEQHRLPCGEDGGGDQVLGDDPDIRGGQESVGGQGEIGGEEDRSDRDGRLGFPEQELADPAGQRARRRGDG
jgi:hypothetical protein